MPTKYKLKVVLKNVLIIVSFFVVQKYIGWGESMLYAGVLFLMSINNKLDRIEENTEMINNNLYFMRENNPIKE